MEYKLKKVKKTTTKQVKYSNTIFINGNCHCIDRLNKKKRTREFIQDFI